MYRIKAGMTQQILGKKLGLTFPQVQKYEKGTNRIGGSRLQQISEALDVPVSFLFDGLPGPKISVSKESFTNDLEEFMRTALGRRLVQGFTKIPDKNVRKHLTRLIESIGENGTREVRKRTRKKKSA